MTSLVSRGKKGSNGGWHSTVGDKKFGVFGFAVGKNFNYAHFESL